MLQAALISTKKTTAVSCLCPDPLDKFSSGSSSLNCWTALKSSRKSLSGKVHNLTSVHSI